MSTVKVGAQIAGVRLDELVARTATSEVYRGIELASGMDVAIKVLAHSDASAGRRLRREASLLQQLDHPSIVPFHSLEQHQDDLILVTSWVEGSSLRDEIRANPNRSGTAGQLIQAGLGLVKDLAEPLDYLHQRDIVHRDISPGNIIMTRDQTPVLVDLGIGHRVGTATLTNHDLLAGTPKYLAPEIIRGEVATGRSDQYSLAVVAYEWVAGRSPFPASDEIATALHHQLHTEPEPLIEVAPSVPAPFSAAVMRALAKDPALRFASVTDFAQAAHATSVERSHRAWSSRSVAVVGVAVLVVLGAVLAWLNRGEPETAAVTAAETTAEVVTRTVAATEVDPTWPVGTAASLGCNQLVGRDFESGTLPIDYFSKPPGRERVVEAGGYGGTWALEVGLADAFGQYGEMIPVTPGERYFFRGWFSPVGEIGAAELGISLLDANSEGLDITTAQPIALDAAGFAQVRLDDVPDGAVFAVPYLYKDASPGLVLVDELVFGVDAACGAEIAAIVGDS